MKIKIEDYLSKEEIKEIVASEVKLYARDNLKEFIHNLSFNLSIDLIDNVLSKEQKSTIIEKVETAISNLSSFEVFYKDEYRCSGFKSLGYSIVEETVSKNEEIIEAKIRELLENLNAEDTFRLLLETYKEK